MWSIWVILISLRKDLSSFGNLCAFRHPIHGSIPILIDIPDYIFHVMLALIMCRDFITAFHIIDTPEWSLCGWLSRSIKFKGEMYFDTTTLVHRLFDVTSFHPSFTTKAVEKSSNFLMPQPPHLLGKFRASHLTHANILPVYCPFQRNL